MLTHCLKVYVLLFLSAKTLGGKIKIKTQMFLPYLISTF